MNSGNEKFIHNTLSLYALLYTLRHFFKFELITLRQWGRSIFVRWLCPLFFQYSFPEFAMNLSCEYTLNSQAMSLIHYDFTMNSLWNHYLFREGTINSLLFANSLWFYYELTWCFVNILWSHYPYREFTMNPLSISLIHYDLTMDSLGWTRILFEITLCFTNSL